MTFRKLIHLIIMYCGKRRIKQVEVSSSSNQVEKL